MVRHMNKTEQAKIINAAKNGDKQAFERLYADYRDRLHLFVLKNVGSRETAEDIVSETFLDAMKNIGSLKTDEAFGAWLYSIAYRKCIRHGEDNARTAHFESEEEQEIAIADSRLNDPIELPEDYAVNRQRREQLKAIIDGLTPETRSAVILYYYNEQSVKEVAKTLGISESAAAKRLFDARRKIKAKVETLMKSGSFCAAPLGALLHSTIDSKYAASAAKAGASVKSISAVKAALISTAAVTAIGIPIVFFSMHGGWAGDVRTDEPSAASLAETDTSEGESLSAYDKKSVNGSGMQRVFPDDFLEHFTYSMTFRDFDETRYTVKGEELDKVKEMLSRIEGVPCEDPGLSGWYMFDIDAAIEINRIHSLTMTGNYICFDGVMYRNDEPDNGRELAEYFRENGTVTVTSDDLDAEFELVQYNSSTRSGYAVSEAYGLASFSLPEVNADIFDEYGSDHAGLLLNITWSGNVSESYPIGLEDVTSVSIIGETEDFSAKYLDDVVIRCLLAGDDADINAEVEKTADLSRQEKEGLSWLAGNKLYSVRESDELLGKLAEDKLKALFYTSGTNDGMPEYTLKADDGTLYQLNISGRNSAWVRRGDDEEAAVSEELAGFLLKYRDRIGLLPVSRN